MTSAFRVSAFTVSFLFLFGGVAGCSSEDEEAIEGPPPSEALVFEASSETRAELGVAKWGFEVDESTGTSTFRGYSATNAVRTTVVQRNDTSSERQMFHMEMTGPIGSASESIEFWAENDDVGERRIMLRVDENTFEEGSVARKVLARFDADGKSSGATVGASTSLVTRARPMNGDHLVSTCNESVKACLNPLIDARGAYAGQANDCGALARVGMPLLACAGGAAATLPLGPGAVLGCGAGATFGVGAAEIKCASSRQGATETYAKWKQCDEQACPQPSGPQIKPRE